MYAAILDVGYEKTIRENAMPTIIAEREQFYPILGRITEFCKEHQLIISSIGLLLNEDITWESIELYTTNSDVPYMLRDILCLEHPKDIMLQVLEPDNEYTITFDVRRLCNIFIMPGHSLPLREYVTPIHKLIAIKGFSTVNLLPPIFELIHLYDQLYDVKQAGKWVDILSQIKLLEIIFDRDLDKTELSSPYEEKGCKSVENRLAILNAIKNKPFLLIGTSAYSIYSKKDVPDDLDRIQLITCDTKENVYAMMYDMFKTAIDVDDKPAIFPKEYFLRTSTYTLPKSSRGHVADVYNNGRFELMPYREYKDIKIADPIVQLRFNYIRTWQTIVDYKDRNLSFATYERTISMLHEHIKFFRSYVNINKKKTRMFGIYRDVTIEKKKVRLSTQDRSKKKFFCIDTIPDHI
jgi:hypothetical protein